jgi:ubiquinone/menaquinone biosynthesis C-methylase UbiE
MPGTGPSPGMIESARKETNPTEYPNVEYRISSAETLPFLHDHSVDMVVAGQAAH